MMETKKVIVEYMGRSDLECICGVANGVEYYFLKNGKLGNGNIIASTALVEAVDPNVVPKQLGVLDPEGNIVIPFNHKIIRPLTNQLLLVEPFEVKSKSVLASLASRSDPLAAMRLVNIDSTIKDRMNEKLGSNGRYAFNNQCSEATVVTIDGENILNGEYYSYIGLNQDTIYLCKNTVDSKIDEYELNAPVMKKDIFETAPQVEPEHSLDLGQVVVDKATIDEAVGNQTIEAVLPETSQEQVHEEAIDTVVESPVVEEKTEVKEEETIVKANDHNIVDFSLGRESISSMPSEELPTVEATKIEDNVTDSVLNITGGTLTDVNEETTNFSDSSQVLEKAEEALAKEEVKYGTEDMISTSDVVEESSDYYSASGESIFQDAASTLAELIEQNKHLTEENKELGERVGVLETRLSTSNNRFSRYERTIGALENRLEKQAAIIDNQESELNELKSQLQGKQDFVKLLDEAQGLLGRSGAYETESSGYAKVA